MPWSCSAPLWLFAFGDGASFVPSAWSFGARAASIDKADTKQRTCDDSFSTLLDDRRGSAGPLQHSVRRGGFFADVRHSEDARRVPGPGRERVVTYFVPIQRQS